MKDMTKGKIWQVILVFALPIFISNLFQQLYNACDSMIVGKFIGDTALAAVSSSGNLIFLFTSFFIGTASGASVLISKYYGEKNYDKLSKTIHTNLCVGLIAGIILTFVGVFLSPVLLRLMDTAPNVLPSSIEYFKCYFYGAIGLVLYNICSSTLNALGDSKRTLVYLIISSLMNIVLDLLFIGVFKFGVGAAGIATAISQLFSVFLCMIHLMKKGHIYTVSFSQLKIDKEIFFLTIKYGIPAGIQNSVIALANVFVQKNINSFGDVAMSGCGTYSKLEGFAFLPITSFTIALTTFVSQNVGAKEYDRARKGSLFGIISSCLLAEIIGVLMFFLMPYLAKLFTNNPESIAISTKQAKTICLFYFLLAYSHSIAAILRGCGKAFVPMIIMLVVWCILRVTYITIVLSFKHEITLLFLAYPITWTISSIIYAIYYKFNKFENSFKRG